MEMNAVIAKVGESLYRDLPAEEAEEAVILVMRSAMRKFYEFAISGSCSQ